MDLDSFFVSVERIKNPSLHGKPVIVGAVGNRGVVCSCSYEARKFGVHSGMSGYQAHKLCPHGIYISGDHYAYSSYSRMVTDIVAAHSPIFEKASIDEFYIDLSGMDKFFGTYKWSIELRKKIMNETKLPISFGLAANKMLAKMATNKAKPNGFLQILPEEVDSFLEPLPVGKIPFVGEKMVQSLNRLRIYSIQDLKNFPFENLTKIYGKLGVMLWKRARGIDNGIVSDIREEKSLSVERTFHEADADLIRLQQILFTLTEKLSFDLRKLKRMTACVTVKIRYADFSTFSKQLKIRETLSTKTLIEVSNKLLNELIIPSQAVRLLGVRFSALSLQDEQLELFDNQVKDRQLYGAVDKIKSKHGTQKIMLANSLGMDKIRKNNHIQSALKKNDKPD